MHHESPEKKRSPFDSYLPQGSETDAAERRESYEKAVAERQARQEDRSEQFRQSLDEKRWLSRFERVWQDDGKQTSADK